MVKPQEKTKYAEQELGNRSFDEIYGTYVFQIFDTPTAVKVTTVGSITYVAKAPVGSDPASAVWQAQKIDSTSDVVITWADSGNFSQVATDLTTLVYS